MSLSNDLNRVLRYSMDTVENLLSQLASKEHDHTRWGTEAGDQTFRGVLADAIDESERPHRTKEAELLRTPNQHVMIVDGRVRPALFTGSPIGKAAYALDNFIDQNAPELGTPDIGWHFPVGHDRTGTAAINTTGFADDADYVHLSEAGDKLADAYHNELTRTDHPVLQHPQYEEMIHRLRTAPYEEVNLGHHTERDNGFGFDDPNVRGY